jgi:hypothetical protein
MTQARRNTVLLDVASARRRHKSAATAPVWSESVDPAGPATEDSGTDYPARRAMEDSGTDYSAGLAVEERTECWAVSQRVTSAAEAFGDKGYFRTYLDFHTYLVAAVEPKLSQS